jgi:phosphate transport system substrate-binding protein
MIHLRRWGLSLLLLASGACKESGDSATKPAAPSGPHIEINGAGSTSIAPLMNKWASEFAKSSPNAQVYYQSVGSGAGVKQLIAKTVDFGATDAPMTEAQLTEAKSPVLHIPLCMGAVVPIYNVPGLAHVMRFTPETLSGIFLGDIKTWNDPKLVAINPLLDLPSTPIAVVHRSDGSGATYELADYLSKVSPAWKSKVGAPSNTITWPVGLGAKGNEGVATSVTSTPGSIGYTELSYALQNRLSIAELKNQAGNFIEASIESVSASAVGEIPDDLRYTLTNATPDKAWPISGTTWAVVYQDMPAGPSRDAVMSFLRWAVHDGQKQCTPLDYAPLPPELKGRVDAKLNQIDHPNH